jgi:diguanylate cyclase (GGDEF)-like protein/PAS domain S-box-containing protein
VLQDHTHYPTAARSTGASAAEEFFERERQDHLDRESRERVLESVLSHYQGAPVAALSSEGLSVAMPSSIPLRGNPVLEARSGLDLVVRADHLRLLAMWDRLLDTGAARCVAHLAAEPNTKVTIYGLDVRESHDVILVVLVPSDRAEEPDPEVAPPPAPPPRFATLVKDERSFIVKIDQAITEILGWSAEEMEGRRSIEFIHPDDHALAIDNWMEMLAATGPGRRVRLRHRRRDGSWVWFEVTNHNLLDDPLQHCVVAEIVDISEEMEAHEELRAREQLLDRLAGAIPLGLFQIDERQAIVYTNDRLHEIVGVERAPTAQEQLALVVESDSGALRRALAGVLDEGHPVDIEVQLRLPADHELRSCAINLCPLSHEDGTVSGAIACVSDVTDSVRMREELKRRATFDELTGCYNRASIMRALESDVGDGTPDAERAVMFVDLDGFKEINDRYGHAAGDELLGVLAARLRRAVRDDDLVGRIGGDEFLVVCPSVGGAESAIRLAERLASAVHEDVALEAGSVAPGVSIGVAWSAGAYPDADTLVARADGAMYESKREGHSLPAISV